MLFGRNIFYLEIISGLYAINTSR